MRCFTVVPSAVLRFQLQLTNVECGTEVAAYVTYVTVESDGGPLLRGLSVKTFQRSVYNQRDYHRFGLGSEPKVDFLPPEAKTAEGFIKSNLTAEGIFAAGTIAESTQVTCDDRNLRPCGLHGRR
ncbi:MAG: hypothetical protein ACTS6P_01960 [Candidatus Hodgkinia cicadicola]